MKLSILIATTIDRQHQFEQLYKELILQSYGLMVEVLYLEDNKEMSIGTKRQKLLEMATGDWIVFFDSDDEPSSSYVSKILSAIENDCDCIGIRGFMTTNGTNRKSWVHRLGLEIKGDGITKVGEYDYTRPIIHFNPVKRELALKAGFKDLRYGEDMDYAKRLNPLLKKEYFIDSDLFHYKYSNKEPHASKYGIKG